MIHRVFTYGVLLTMGSTTPYNEESSALRVVDDQVFTALRQKIRGDLFFSKQLQQICRSDALT